MAGVGGGRTVAGGSLTMRRNDGYMFHDGLLEMSRGEAAAAVPPTLHGSSVCEAAAAVPPTHCCHGELIARQRGSGASRTDSRSSGVVSML